MLLAAACCQQLIFEFSETVFKIGSSYGFGIDIGSFQIQKFSKTYPSCVLSFLARGTFRTKKNRVYANLSLAKTPTICRCRQRYIADKGFVWIQCIP
ncbi:hypothetical protein L596_009426 [Steinernema carpocapsae]|uniref:Uncharacterized protein n=1 Tax=Steinernema carpocapsae TaxID=34508 RepID=A0A4U5PFB5_STECR|nr:hypothetical protein L596_009426 [Steinernema carpocapsae]